jgi:hypothetical protein
MSNEHNIFNNYEQIFLAIQKCLADKLIIPALVLIYSTIDSISWLSSSDNNSKNSFLNWVNNWMLGKFPLPCSALELYAARCGLLHTLTPSSDLSETKGVREISYAWGKAELNDLEETIKILDYQYLVAVHVDDLFSSLKNGFVEYLTSLENDNCKKDLFSKKAKLHFINTEKKVITDFLESHKNSPKLS